MTRIKEWNQATGHVETLADVPDDQAAAFLASADDHSTDHVIYADSVSDEVDGGAA